MSNLILEKDKKKIRSEYLGRLLIVILSATLLLFVLSILLILPSFVISRDKTETVEERLSFLRDYTERQKDKELPLIIQETKEKIDLLSQKESEKVFDIIKIITENEGNGILLESFSFRALPDGEYQSSISGISQNRDTLIAFRRRLESQKKFAEVNLPISNLAESIDLEFSMTLNIESTNAEAK